MTTLLAHREAALADAAGNVYVAGTSQGDLVTLKHSPDGTLLWEDRQARLDVRSRPAVRPRWAARAPQPHAGASKAARRGEISD